jgi:hypothetical protein
MSIVLPLLFDSVELPLSLRKRKYADLADFDRGLAAILRVVGRKMITYPVDELVLTRIREVLTDGPGKLAVDSGQEMRS